jgi:hypothetical protein
MEPKHPSPRATFRPIPGPSPHMQQLLDSGTWHQQQLIQLAAFSHPHTQWFISQLELTFSSTGILERIKNFTIPKSFIQYNYQAVMYLKKEIIISFFIITILYLLQIFFCP